MDSGDTAWLLASTALVLLMAPGLAFFYGGMVRSKSVLNIMMMVFYALAIFPIVWFLFGYSLAFGDDIGGGLLGGGEFFGLRGIAPDTLTGTVPTYVFVVFQMLFGVITIGLVAGAIATRNAWWLLAALACGYGFAWIGHFFFEKNRPATFRHPFYSFAGDWVMFFDILRGRVKL